MRAPIPRLGEVDDAHRRLAVEGIVDEPQIREQILDLLALEELEAAEHLIGDAVRGKLLLERPRQSVQAHQNGEVGIFISPVHQPRYRMRYVPRLAALLLRLENLRLFPLVVLRPERLVLAMPVIVNDRIGEL